MARLTMALMALVMIATPALAQTARHDDDAQLLAELRAELASLKLAVERMKAQRQELIEFLEDERGEGVAARLAEWRAERAKLTEDRRLIRAERLRLEAARKALHETTARQARQQALDAAGEPAEQPADTEPAARKLEPDWSAQAQVGLIDRDGGDGVSVIYVQADRVVVTADNYPTIDQKNVMVRGNLLNKSLAAWRYTFEVRLFSRAGLGGPKLQGSWRYQTPLLGPGDLHQLEVRVPVDNARLIDAIQFVKVTADRPADQPPVPLQPQAP